MLCKVDGERSVADLAADCGFTVFEAGHIIAALVKAGLVDMDVLDDDDGLGRHRLADGLRRARERRPAATTRWLARSRSSAA